MIGCKGQPALVLPPEIAARLILISGEQLMLPLDHAGILQHIVCVAGTGRGRVQMPDRGHQILQRSRICA